MMKKKLLMFLLAGSMILTSTGFAELGASTVHAEGDIEADADEDVQEDLPPEEVEDEEVIEEVEEVLIESETVLSDEAMEKELPEPGIIESFVELSHDETSYHYDGLKPSMDILLEEVFPEAVEAVLTDGRTVELPVEWVTEDDYDAEDYSIFWAEWDAENFPLVAGFNYEDYMPFVEVIVDNPTADYLVMAGAGASSIGDLSGLSSGVQNIVKRAYQQVQIEWTPLKNVKGFEEGDYLSGTFYAGSMYEGIPYGQPVSVGKYVPHSASFDTFLNAVKDANSDFYKTRGSYDSQGFKFPYYSSDCSAFASYSYGHKRMTTSSIAKSDEFAAVDSVDKMEVGDCLNKGGSHVIMITGIERDSDGKITKVEISEQTPPQARTLTYTLTEFNNLKSKNGYTLLRFKERDKVAAPDTYKGYGQIKVEESVVKIEATKVNYPGTLKEGTSFSITGNINADSNLTNVTVGIYDVDGNLKFGKSVTPNRTVFNIETLDSFLKFDELKPGVYRYKVEASTAKETDTKLASKVFVVLSKGATISDGVYQLQDTSAGYALSIFGSENKDGSNVEMNLTDDSQYQRFLISHNSAGYYNIVNLGSGMTLNVVKESGDNGYNVIQSKPADASGQLWQILPCGKNYCFVPKSDTSICLALGSANATSGTNLVAKGASMGATQTFKVVSQKKTACETHKNKKFVVVPSCMTGAKEATVCTVCNTATIKSVTKTSHSYVKNYCSKCGGRQSLKTPELKSATNVNSGVKITWGAVTDSLRYRVYRKVSGGSWGRIGETTGTSYTDKNVESSKTYYYTVRCITEDSAYTLSGYNADGLKKKFIGTPVLTALTNAPTGPKLSWEKVPGAELYRIYRKSGTGSWTKLKDTKDLSMKDTTAKSGTKYSYTVRCFNAAGTANTSGYDNTGKTIIRLSEPTVTLSKVSDGVKITWTKVTGAEKYYVYRKTGSEGWKRIKEVTTLNYTDKTAAKGVKYYYTVRAVKETSLSSYPTDKTITR